jgi:sigma-B regulation protein RsbU (phosphoserine phosphatase)
MDELSVGGMVVGIDPSQRYQRALFDLRPRDLLVAYTDGLVDTTNFSGERFGKKRLRAAVLKFLGEQPEPTAAQVVDRIMWEVRQFAGLSPRPDDQTVIAVRVL